MFNVLTGVYAVGGTAIGVTHRKWIVDKKEHKSAMLTTVSRRLDLVFGAIYGCADAMWYASVQSGQMAVTQDDQDVGGRWTNFDGTQAYAFRKFRLLLGDAWWRGYL